MLNSRDFGARGKPQEIGIGISGKGLEGVRRHRFQSVSSIRKSDREKKDFPYVI